MFQKLGERLRQVMVGRNGPDDLTRFMLVVAFILIVVGMFMGDLGMGAMLTVLIFALIAYCYFRMFSRKVGTRSRENRQFIRLRSKALDPCRRLLASAKEWKTYHKTHRVYRCRACGQNLRVPKGKGSIKVSCPKCKETFTTKS